jgi:hypothetical protein
MADFRVLGPGLPASYLVFLVDQIAESLRLLSRIFPFLGDESRKFSSIKRRQMDQ